MESSGHAWPGRTPYRSTTASLTYTPICPAGTASAGPVRGSTWAGSAPSGRLSTVRAGRAALSCRGLVRRGDTLSTPGRRATASAKPGGSRAASPPAACRAERTYSGEGSTASSHWMTEPRKLATITVSATARLRLATTPPTAMAAVPRMRRARSSASRVSGWRAASGCRRCSSQATPQGSSAMPPTSSRPIAT